MKTLLLTLALAVPLLASEMTPPTASGGLSYEAVGYILAAALSAYGGYKCGTGFRVQGEIKELKDFATREELDTLRRDVYADMNRLASEIGTIKTYTSEIKGELEHIASTQQQILKHLINK